MKFEKMLSPGKIVSMELKNRYIVPPEPHALLHHSLLSA